ncbi:MAG: hypothetical protein QNK26_14305 [Moritella sp.]|uniref:hypothetical protein n=1 Tax=Moritella sp. TaxID=78556 RepID=UPI0029B99DD1|nr:hypothetical protein [Moritella sp.]MDX2321756.1 hypothetical protein [Moritella sp.]
MMKCLSLILFCSQFLFGCVQEPNYELSASTEYVKDIQILDPDAPAKNDGITNAIEGKYGEKVISSYHKSAYEAKSARNISQVSESK